jgi:hypothetical protein
MTRFGKMAIVSEMVGYGLSLNFGYPFDTVTAAIVAAAIVVGTWAVDGLVAYLRGFRDRT